MSGARIGFRNGTLFWLAAVLLAAALPAQGQIYFGISPIRAEHRIKPGGSLTEVFLIRNNDAGPIRIKVYGENWTIRDDGTAAFIGETPTTYSSKDWIVINPQDFRMNPGETKSVRYTIAVPPGTSPGGYHSAISFETVPDASAARAGNRMLFTGKIAAAVYVIAGRPAVEGDLVDFTLGEKTAGRPSSCRWKTPAGRTSGPGERSGRSPPPEKSSSTWKSPTTFSCPKAARTSPALFPGRSTRDPTASSAISTSAGRSSWKWKKTSR